MRFTAEEALDGQVGTLSEAAAARILQQHTFTIEEYREDVGQTEITAQGLFEWMGY